MSMDINLLRSLVTVAAFAAFVGIMWWAYTPARKARFERDALLPFDESELLSVVELSDSAQPSPPPPPALTPDPSPGDGRGEARVPLLPLFGRRVRDEGTGEGRFVVQMGRRPFARESIGERK